MENLSFLVISSNPEVLAVILRLLNNKKETWTAEGAENLATAPKKSFDVLLFDIGVSKEQASELTQEFQKYNADIKSIWHYGGGSGLLYNEIQMAFA